MSILIKLVVICLVCGWIWNQASALTATGERDALIAKNFEKWFVQNGGVLKGVKVSSYEGMGRGLEAQDSISANQLVLSVPSSIVMSLSNMQKSTDPNVQSIYNAFPNEVGLTLWILFERIRPNSRFKEYMEVLPHHVPSLITFTARELEELQHDTLIQEALELQETIHSEFSSVQEHVRSGKSPSLPVELNSITLGQYIWAATILNSRGLRFRGQVYLAPMADLFNYEAHPEKRTANSGEFFLKHHNLDKTTGNINIYADRSQSKGLQLFEDYGDNMNEIYIKYHGFVPNRNPFHCVTIGGEKVIRQVTAQLPARKPLLDALHFKSIHPSCVDERLVLGRHLEVYLIANAMNSDEMNVCMKAIHKHKKDWNKIFQLCGFATAAEYLKDKLAGKEVNSMISNPVTDLEEDEYEDIHAQESSRGELTVLGERAWTLLQQVFLANVKDAARTTIHEDVDALMVIESTLEEKGASMSADAAGALWHKEVATKYRLTNKRAYLALCGAFQVSCEFLIRRDGEMSEVKLKSAASAQTMASQAPSKNRSVDLLVQDFNQWFQSHHPHPGHLKAVPMPIYRIGTVATEKIKKGELYLGVPQILIMDSEKASQSSGHSSGASGLSSLLTALQTTYRTRDDFHELLFFLLHETFVLRERSFYWPYLHLLPTPKDLDIPILWSAADLKSRLHVSALHDAAIEYQESVQRKFHFIRNITLVRDFFGDDILSFENYRWATAILDSRSIWWNGRRHLVPMLDFINCKEGRDPSAVHSTVLDEEGRYAVTRAGDDFEAGEQVFENYGQPNHIYYLYHGFSLAANSHDCLQVRFPVRASEIRALEEEGLQKFLTHLGLTAESRVFTSCLRQPISPQVWAFLAFKTRSHVEALRERRLGSPSTLTASYLVRFLESLVPQYASALETVTHSATLAFLQSENALLATLLTELKARFPDIDIASHDHDEL